MLRRLHPHLTYSNVMSVVAMSAVLGGTAWAATQPAASEARAAKRAKPRTAPITGANIKDSTLTGADFRNGSLALADLTSTTRSLLRGRRGATGERGPSGATGAQGATGDRGAAGASAHSLVRFATQESELLLTNRVVAAPNASAPADWDSDAYAPYAGSDSNHPQAEASTHPNLADTYSSSSTFPTEITSNEPVLVQLTGNNQSTTGTIRPTSTGLLTATATLTIMHSWHAESEWDGGRPLHSRVRCTLRYANNGASLSAGSPTLGAPEWLSSRSKHGVFTITLTGSEKVTGNATANYNVGVSCADVDTTGFTQWTFVAGSINAHSTFIES
jgi:hypothetical protein